MRPLNAFAWRGPPLTRRHVCTCPPDPPQVHAALPDAKQLLCIVERLCDRLAGDDTVSLHLARSADCITVGGE